MSKKKNIIGRFLKRFFGQNFIAKPMSRLGAGARICWSFCLSRVKVLGFGGKALLVFVLFVLFNIAFSPISERKLDFTAEGLSTLSSEAIHFLGELDSDFQLTLYASSKLVREVPTYADYERRALALLNEMARHSNRGGRRHVSVIVVRPEPFSEEEDEALESGLSPVSIDQSGEQVFFGLKITRLATSAREEKNSLLPFLILNKEQSLEYEIMRSIVELARTKKPRITLITSLEPLGGYGASAGFGAWRSFQALAADFDIETVFVSEDFDKETDLVVLLHPRIQDQELLYALDQYMLAGGRALLFLDPYYESASANPQRRTSSLGVTIPLSSSSFPLLARWGITIPADMIVADEQHAMLIDGGSLGRVEPIPHLAWLQLAGKFLSDREPVRKINNLIIASAGAILLQEKNASGEGGSKNSGEVSSIPLIRSSVDTDLLDLDFFISEPPELLQAYEDFEAQGEQRTLGISLSGRFSSMFDERPKGMKEEANGTSSHLSDSEKPFKAIIVSDADFLNDRFWVEKQNFLGETIFTPFSGNGAFLLDAVEWLVGVKGLAGLRSRGVGDRPLIYLERLRLRAEGRWRLEQNALNEKLQEIEQRLAQIRDAQQERADGALKDTDVDGEVVKSFTQQLVETRGALRKIQRALNRDVGSMQTIVQVFHAIAMPLLVALFFLIVVWRRRRADSKAE